uniref:Hachiman antiphage defense system protein HamA n=1 Tax=Stomatohabitans albus TaxID=3110766 RepID=UPI00300D4613
QRAPVSAASPAQLSNMPIFGRDIADDDDKVALLASILLPPASGAPTITKSNAFGVFVGFELDVTTFPFADHTVEEIETHLRDLALSAISDEVDTIKSEILNRGLGGYQFHIYAVPFLKRNVNGTVRGIEDIRIDLASELSGKNLRLSKDKAKK